MADTGRHTAPGRAHAEADGPNPAGGSGVARGQSDYPFPALEAKTRRPLTRLRTVHRDGLLRSLSAVGDDVPLIMVIAPPGYGKTTALSQWARTSERPFGWVQLDETDNDPMSLLRKVALALHRTRPLDDAVWRALVSREYAAVDVAIPRLLAFLRAYGASTVLVLDDLQCLRRTAALDVVMTLAVSLPRGCHLVAAGRRRPRVRLGRLLGQGGYAEFGPADLAFSRDEAGALVSRIGLDLPSGAVSELIRRTEGWPAGVYLAALSLMSGSDDAAAIGDVTAGSRFITDYFRDEILDGQSAETARFLLRTSPLDAMTGPLCDAVLGATGSAAWLSEIEELNLFVEAEDERREWFRYHPLFREVLLGELRRREPGEDLRIRRRAAAWFEEQGRPEQAIGYAVAGEDTATAARLITTYTQVFANHGRIPELRGLLDDLDDGSLRASPPLAITATLILAFTGEAPRAQRALHIAESGTFAGPLPDGSASLTAAVARVRAALAPYGVEHMLADAEAALALEPPGSPWHPMAVMLHGVASMLSGSPEVAIKAFEQAARLGREAQRPSASFALAQRALLAADHGDWFTAEACAAESRQLLEAGGLQDFLPNLLTYAACARVEIHRGDVQAARVDAVNALQLYRRPSPVALPWLATQSAIVLGRILLDLGDEPAARLKAMEAERHLGGLVTEGVLGEELQKFAAVLDRVPDRSQAHDTADLTKAELRILHLLPTHLSLNEIGHELFISRNTVKSQVAAIYRKLHVANRTEAVREGREIGLIDE